MKWEELSFRERAEYIKTGVKNGLRDINDIKGAYNKFQDGGNLYGGNNPKGQLLKSWDSTPNPAEPWVKLKLLQGKWANTAAKDAIVRSKKEQLINEAKTDPILRNTLIYNTPEGEDPIRAEIESKYPYIGGKPWEARQKYYDYDTEFTDSVRSIAGQYNLDPNLLATRIAQEGVVDNYINNNNESEGGHPRQEETRGASGPVWGLDDFGDHLEKGLVKLRVPFDYENNPFVNERGRDTNSMDLFSTTNNNDWALGIHGIASELEYRRKELKKRFPHLNNNQLDVLANASFKTGISKAAQLQKEGSKFKNSQIEIKLKNKKALGGNLYGGNNPNGQTMARINSLFGLIGGNQNAEPDDGTTKLTPEMQRILGELNSRNKGFEFRVDPKDKATRLYAIRQRDNDSKTKEASQILEDDAARYVGGYAHKAAKDGIGELFAETSIPYKEELVRRFGPNKYIPTNMLDSVAKYAGMTRVPMEAGVGLLMESQAGTVANQNSGDPSKEPDVNPLGLKGAAWDRALFNTNYIKNFGSIPANLLVRDLEYVKGEGNKGKAYSNMYPLEHAFNYYNANKYNPGQPAEDERIEDYGKLIMGSPEYTKWWKESGEKWYNKGKAQFNSRKQRNPYKRVKFDEQGKKKSLGGNLFQEGGGFVDVTPAVQWGTYNSPQSVVENTVDPTAAKEAFYQNVSDAFDKADYMADKWEDRVSAASIVADGVAVGAPIAGAVVGSVVPGVGTAAGAGTGLAIGAGAKGVSYGLRGLSGVMDLYQAGRAGWGLYKSINSRRDDDPNNDATLGDIAANSLALGQNTLEAFGAFIPKVRNKARNIINSSLSKHSSQLQKFFISRGFSPQQAQLLVDMTVNAARESSEDAMDLFNHNVLGRPIEKGYELLRSDSKDGTYRFTKSGNSVKIKK